MHHRRSIRLKEYDYSSTGAYFVTICTQNRECLFGDITDCKMELNHAGSMVQNVWGELLVRFPNMDLDKFIIMPNHFHGIVVLPPPRRGESCIRPCSDDHKTGDHKDRPNGTLPGTLGRITQAFKSITTHKYISGVRQNRWSSFPGKLWQRNYYEHVIRNDDELNRIREYIINNPLQWESDRENPTISRMERVRAEGWQS